MKQVLPSLLLTFILVSCDRQSEPPQASTTVHTARKGMGLPYIIPASATRKAGHQAYLFGDTWASSREDIIRCMTQAGWLLVPDYRPTDSSIRFYSDSSSPMNNQNNPIKGTRWEHD